MPNPPTFPYAFTCPTHGAVHSRTPEPCCGNALPVHAICDGTEPRLTGMDVLAASMAAEAPAADSEAIRVYLAGPMRGYPDFNAPAFREAAASLRSTGHEVFCPTERDDAHGFTPDGMALEGTEEELDAARFDLRRALGDDLAWITRHADAVAVLPGWEASRGATAEVATARALSLPVWELDALLAGGKPLDEKPATPPGSSEDEIRSAIADIIAQAVPGAGALALADWITDRVVGPELERLRRIAAVNHGLYKSAEADVAAATPPGRSADEIRSAIRETVRACDKRPAALTVADDDAARIADALMDRVVGPLIAERDSIGHRMRVAQAERNEAREARDGWIKIGVDNKADLAEQRQRADQAEAERDDAERRARRLSADLDEVSAERDEQRQRAERAEATALVWRDRFDLWFNRAQRYRLAWQSARRRALAFSSAWAAASEDTDGLVGGLRRGIADRDATIAELRQFAEDLRQQILAAEREADVAGMELGQARQERDRLREADARVRELRARWGRTREQMALPELIELFDAMLHELDAALHGTDGDE